MKIRKIKFKLTFLCLNLHKIFNFHKIHLKLDFQE